MSDFHTAPSDLNCATDAAPIQFRTLGRRAVLHGLRGLAALAMIPSASFALTGHLSAGPTFHRIKRATSHGTATAADLKEWQAFRARFITAEGRVVDTGNHGVSHSEGQGYGMLLAEWANDRTTFEKLFTWTVKNLSRPYDNLHAWCWEPSGPVHVRDLNSATDGDLSIAWALLRAAQRWNEPAWQGHAMAIAQNILNLATREAGGRLFLMPGAFGFEKADRLQINPSYYNFPAIRAFAYVSDDERWTRLDRDGLWLLAAGGFGERQLPSDWVDVMLANAEIREPTNGKFKFSWDAIRVPLYLAWAGENNAQALNATAAFWTSRKNGSIPAWVNLANGQHAPYEGHAGIIAVAKLCMAATQLRAGEAGNVECLPKQATAPDYYAGALAMLSRMAWQESRMKQPAAETTVMS